jgi:hypothetical protein
MPNRLHLHGPQGHPLCGRQLSPHRAERAQDQSTMIAGQEALFLAALHAPKPHACRWCARVAGLLSPVARARPMPGLESESEDDLEGEEE